MEHRDHYVDRSGAITNLVDRSDSLKNAQFARQAFDTSLLGAQDILHCLAETFPNPNSRLRLFVENKVIERVMLPRYLSNPPCPTETLEEWSRRVFIGREFGIILNDVESFYEPLVEKMIPYIEQFQRGWGYPLGGLELCLLIGNYGFTPFGVHTDSHLDGGVHFVLGPGQKTFYHWSREDYFSVNGSWDACEKPSKSLLNAARSYSLQAGDIFYLPGEGYHIAECNGVAASLLLAIRRYNYVVRYAIRRIEETLCERDYPRVVSNSPPSCARRVSDDPYTSLSLDEKLLARDWLGESVHYVACRHFSNRSLGPTSTRPEARFDLRSESVIKVTEGFPLMLWAGGQSDMGPTLFVRGHEVDVGFVPAVEEFIKALNAGEISVLKAWDAHFQKANLTDQGRILLWELYKYRGVSLKP